MTNRDDVTALALGSLPPQEAERVETALRADPTLLAGYRSDLAALHALPEELPPGQVPEGALERLMERVRAERAAPAPGAPTPGPKPVQVPDRGGWNRNLGWSLGALGLAAAFAVFLALRPPADPLTRYAARPGAVSQPLTGAGDAQIGQVVRLRDGSAFLYLSAAPPPDRVYQLWQIQGETPVSLGVIDGQGRLIQNAPDGITLAVSVEPPGGSEQPTTTPILVQQL